MIPRPAAWLLVLFIAASAIAHSGDTATTVIIVRHAEKDTAKNDPALTAAGRERARELARIVGASALDGVIASDRRRTLETAWPAASARGVRIDTVAREGTLEAYAGRITALLASQYAGRTILIVSHSDIIPALLKAMGVAGTVEIPDTVYDDLFVVTLRSGGRPAFLRLKYGAPTP